MFKLIKILNSGVNVAEPELYKKDEATVFAIGTPVKLSGGKLVNVAATEAPTHIVTEAGASGEYVYAHEITHNMVFETVVTEDPTSLVVGDKVTLEIEDGAAIAVSATTAGGVAEIYELAGATEIGETVYVRF